ncbi:cell division protein FtsX [Croceicoccus mobilis]|uniref:Cell division protein n=1 Tax=Croceicoccus mobilis TaxID=1703339 RepID=A0A916Z3M3_9SPHN|nr:FtsX-like permease family protein [Croceicoccus mobilis]GGD72098.1 cell division protein [Croceicoccus mobilis]
MVSVYSPGRHGLRTKLSGLTAKGRKWRINAGSDPVIKQRAISGPVPWVIAIMTALTVIAAAGGLALGSIAAAAGDELQGGVTVQIAGPPEAEAARQAQAVAALLADDPEIRALRRLDRDERAALIAPWLGDAGFDGEDADDNLLVLPELVEVQLTGEAGEDVLADLRSRVEAVAPDALVSADTSWLAPVGRAIEALQWLALSLVGLLALATLAAVLLASRSALNANRQVIELMHLLGAQDRQVAELFQRAAAVGAGVGGAAGFAVALAVVSGLAGRFEALGPGQSAAGLNPLHWAVLALIPIMVTLLAAVTARLTVLATLRRMV